MFPRARFLNLLVPKAHDSCAGCNISFKTQPYSARWNFGEVQLHKYGLEAYIGSGILCVTEIIMKSTMKVTFCFLVVLSLAIAATTSTFGQTASAQQSPSTMKLSQRQLHQLLATAKTPADHERIAQYYQKQAQLYLNESKTDAEMIEAYKRSPYFNSCLMCVNTSYSLEAAVRSLRVNKQIAEDRAATLQQLATRQEQMAGDVMALASSLGL